MSDSLGYGQLTYRARFNSSVGPIRPNTCHSGIPQAPCSTKRTMPSARIFAKMRSMFHEQAHVVTSEVSLERILGAREANRNHLHLKGFNSFQLAFRAPRTPAASMEPSLIEPSQTQKTLDPHIRRRPRLSPRAVSATATATAASLTRLHGRHGRAWRWPHPAHRFSTYQTEFVIRSFMGGLLDVSRRFLNVRWTFRSTMEVLTRVGGRGNHHMQSSR